MNYRQFSTSFVGTSPLRTCSSRPCCRALFGLVCTSVALEREKSGTCPKTEPYPHNSEFTLNMSTTSSCQKPQVRFYFFLILRIVIVGRCTVTFRRRPMLAHREMCNVTFNTRLLAWLFFKTIFICWPLSGSFSKCRRVLLHCSLHVLRWSLLNSIFPHCSEWPTAEWISTICRWLQWQM